MLSSSWKMAMNPHLAVRMNLLALSALLNRKILLVYMFGSS